MVVGFNSVMALGLHRVCRSRVDNQDCWIRGWRVVGLRGLWFRNFRRVPEFFS